MSTADEVIRRLRLQPHPLEGGYFRETYRSSEPHGERSLNTAIYYLLTGDAVSEMHKLPGDEIYHFYLGDPLETLLLRPDGRGEIVVVGPVVMTGQVPQLVIPGGVWQGSVRSAGPCGYSLIGATMAPGFDYQDYEQGQRAELVRRWPKFEAEIVARTPRG